MPSGVESPYRQRGAVVLREHGSIDHVIDHSPDRVEDYGVPLKFVHGLANDTDPDRLVVLTTCRGLCGQPV